METWMEFNPLSNDFFDDPYDMYKWLRDEAPCYHNERMGFWALSRFEDVVTAHRDWKTFTSTHGLTLDQLTDPDNAAAQAPMIITMDPPEHDRMRKLVSRAFTPRAITRMQDIAQGIINHYLDEVQGAGEFDAVEDWAAPFPVEIISAILGVPEADRQQIRHWTDDLLTRLPGDPRPPQAAMEAGLNQILYFLELIKEKRARPGEDMLDQLIEAEVPDDDGNLQRLTDDEIAGFALLLASAGSETVTKLVGSAVMLFHRYPSEWQKILDDDEKIVNAVEEVLRFWAPSQYQGRFSTVDSEWHGVTLPAGQPVFLLTGAANRDEREYENPDVFDIDREIGLSIGLGHGIHSCLGAALARLESRTAIAEWRRRYPKYEVDEARCRRVNMANVAGYSNVPVAVAA
jgi:cytochrome P450